MNILMEDEYLLVCEKPAGMLSQSDGGEDLVKRISEHINGQAYIINRLDQPVGGLVLMAKNKNVAGALSMGIHNIEKYYMAVVCGRTLDNERLTNYLMHNKRENVTKIVNKGNAGAKIAELEYTRFSETETDDDILTLVKVRLLTGRHHQIRVQMAARGTPLWGDTKYNNKFRFKRGCQTGLYSCGLRLVHPVTKKEINISIKPKGQAFDFFQGEYYD